MEALGHTRKSRAVQGWRVVNSSGRGGNWGRTELCIAITLQIHSTQTCTLSSTSPYSTSITPHAQQHFQVKARDQKQKTAFQIFHFICKGKRRKIEMIIFFLLAHSINICLSVFQYFTTYLYENPLPVFFFPLGLSKAFTHAIPLQETCPQHTILICTAPNRFLHLSEAAPSASRLSPRAADASTLTSPQIIPNLLNELRSAQKHVPPSCSHAPASFPPWEGVVSHSRCCSAPLASSQDCGFQT